MICPTCHNVMIVVEQDKIELDYCPNCSGVWFDSGELELMFESMGLDGNSVPLAALLSSAGAKTTEKERKCPICHRKMRKTTMGRKPAVVIDVCRQGHGVWFDGGEVRELVVQCAEGCPAESGSQERILSFLGDTFKAQGKPAG